MSIVSIVQSIVVYTSKMDLSVTDENMVSPLEYRRPDIGLVLEMAESGKSAEQIRVENDTNSPVDWLIAKIEGKIYKKGSERG